MNYIYVTPMSFHSVDLPQRKLKKSYKKKGLQQSLVFVIA